MSSIGQKGGRIRLRLASQRTQFQSFGPPKAKKSHSGLVREGIFGLNDGLVATIGLVSGEALSHQSHGSVVIAGLSAVGAAMVSMAIGSYLATTSENDFVKKEIADQEQAIRRHPHRERHHVAHLLAGIGVPKGSVWEITENIVRSRPRWLKFMAHENLGIHQNRREHPLKNSLVMGIAVVLGSAPPVLPYLLPISSIEARNMSWGVSVVAALGLGAVKGVLTRTSILKSALAFGVLVSLSATVGALIGMALGNVGL